LKIFKRYIAWAEESDTGIIVVLDTGNKDKNDKTD
jgi:hypothetical protein